MAKIPVNSIKIPANFVGLCELWHSGITCKLYAVSSTGGLTTGNMRPLNCDTDEKWYYSIWRGLSCDVNSAIRAAQLGLNACDESDGGDGHGHDADYPALVEFGKWVNAQVAALAASYGLEDWDD